MSRVFHLLSGIPLATVVGGLLLVSTSLAAEAPGPASSPVGGQTQARDRNPFPLAATATLSDTYAAANNAYFDGEYKKAEGLYLQGAKAVHGPVPALLYNLGNCAFNLGRLGEATYYFRMAEMLGHGDVKERAQANGDSTRRALLEKHRKQIEKGILRYDEGHGVWYALFSMVGPLVSGGAFLLFSLVMFAALFVWTFSSTERRVVPARIMFFSMLAPALVCGFLYFGRAYVDRHYRLGIVVTDDAGLRDAPSTEAPTNPIPEGLEVRILAHNEAGFVKVQVGESRIGYVLDREARALDAATASPGTPAPR